MLHWKQLEKQNQTKAMDSVGLLDFGRKREIPVINHGSFPVPSKNKRDVRTIENIQADIQAKKRLRLAQSTESAAKTEPVAKSD